MAEQLEQTWLDILTSTQAPLDPLDSMPTSMMRRNEMFDDLSRNDLSAQIEMRAVVNFSWSSDCAGPLVMCPYADTRHDIVVSYPEPGTMSPSRYQDH